MTPLVLLMICLSAPVPPGNVFLEGETPRILLPASVAGKEGTWHVLDDRLESADSGNFNAGVEFIQPDLPGIGWYRAEFFTEPEKPAAYTTAAVLKPPAAHPPPDTPVALDLALSWVPPEDPEVWKDISRLAVLAGVRMTRDRLRWRDIQPAEKLLAQDTKYAEAARIQHGAGLDVLQTFHDSPACTWRDESDRGRVPADLRHTWRFCRTLALRFRRTVTAWEPWNEGNADNFGGHAIDELCAHQKAAYLGFKAAVPDLTVCWNPLGGINSEALATGILLNETWPYYDVYTLHSYDWPHDFARLWEPARDAASGRPIWVTEADRGMKADPESEAGDFMHADARRKAEFMAHAIATSLYAGASRYFHFILAQYMEQQHAVQFGLLREDLTPRMSYVAFAAAGRLLAGAECRGRLRTENPDIHVYAFKARPAGHLRDVLVAWTEKRADWPERGSAGAAWKLPAGCRIERIHDYLGRPIGAQPPEKLTSAAVYIVMPVGEYAKLDIEAPPEPAAWRKGESSPIVIQAETPGARPVRRVNGWTQEHVRVMAAGAHDLRLHIYNFDAAHHTGTIHPDKMPPGWRCEPAAWTVSLAPRARQAISLELQVPEGHEGDAWIRFRGNFGSAGKTAAAFRIAPAASAE
jgi:hypothetical protein